MSCCRLDRGALPKPKRPRTLPIQVPPTAIEAQYAKALVRYVIGAMRWAYAPLLREAPKLVKARAAARHDSADECTTTMFAGLPIVIENPAGSFRYWVDTTGRAGTTVMRYPYGYVRGVRGADGDEVDVFIGPDEAAQWVYIVHQRFAPKFVDFDEDKVMLGFPSADAARAAYLAHYDDPRYFGGMTQVQREAFERAVAAARGGKITHVDSLTAVARYDSPESRRVQKLIREAARRLRLKLNKREIARLAKKFAEQTSTYQRVQLHRQVHAALGIAAPLAAEYTQSRIADFVRENVALISRIPQEHHGEIETMVHRAVTSGQLTDDLADDLEDEFALSERHARFIARDQIGKLQADLNHARQRDLGVKKFVWRTMRDERVRGTPGGLYPNAQPSHFDLDGQEFSYDDPPQPPGAQGPLLPGDDYNCRCYAEPVFDELVEDLRVAEVDPDEASMEAE
jgi:SPP1 gp7 family putative phage head morphogenesis protein